MGSKGRGYDNLLADRLCLLSLGRLVLATLHLIYSARNITGSYIYIFIIRLRLLYKTFERMELGIPTLFMFLFESIIIANKVYDIRRTALVLIT
jgi:hypothetical protein